MEYFTQKDQEPYHPSYYEANMESSRKQNRFSHDLPPTTGVRTNGSAYGHGEGVPDQARTSYDSKGFLTRNSLDIKHMVRAAFQKESSRLSVDGRETATRGSPRFGGGGEGLWYARDGPRSSVDSVRSAPPLKASTESPRLPPRIREIDRSGPEGRLDSGWTSYDSNNSVRYPPSLNSSISRPPEVPTARSSSSDSRLLVELRESPRLSRDAPRYSCDGRDVFRSSASIDNVSAVLAREESARSNANSLKDVSRLVADGRVMPSAYGVRHSLDRREGSYLSREMPMAGRADLSNRSYRGAQPEVDMDEPQSQRSYREERKRAPSLVARLMGLEDMPDNATQQGFPQASYLAATSFGSQDNPDRFVPQNAAAAPSRQPSKESKLLKGLLQYNPPIDQSSSFHESRPSDTRQDLEQLKHMFGSRRQQQPQRDTLPTMPPQVPHHEQHPHVWNDNLEAPPRPVRFSSKQLGMETMPTAFKQQEAKELGILRQKVVRGMPKQLTEAVLTALKINDDSKKLPLSYADMENRLRQLKLRSSLQEHKTLRQVLEAMQVKGLLNGASRTRDPSTEPNGRHPQAEARPQLISTLPNSPKKIILPKPQEYNPDASRGRNYEDLKRVGTGLRERASESTPDESAVKASRPNSQTVSSKVARESEEQEQSASGVSIVVMKPVVNLGKQSNRARNPALMIESMPSARSPNRSRESSGRTSPWGSPLNRPKQQPGFGFGRGPTGRFNSEESVSQRPRREKLMPKAGQSDPQAEANISRVPNVIALPQAPSKLSALASREDTEPLKNIRVDTSMVESNRNGERGRRAARSTAAKEEPTARATSKTINSKPQSTRSSSGNKPLDSNVDTEKPRKSNHDSKLLSERTRSKSTGPAEVIILRNKSSTGKRVSMAESEPRSKTGKRTASNGALRSGVEETARTKGASGSAPAASRSAAKGTATERIRRKDEQPCEVVDRVRETDGAQDLSNVRTPLIGLTNRLQTTENGHLSEPEKEGTGVKTPRTGILTKNRVSNGEEESLKGCLDGDSEHPQPSPVSVLDPGSFQEDDASPYVLNKTSEEMRDFCGSEDQSIVSVQDLSAPLSEARAIKVPSLVDDENLKQLIFLKECAKILPPQGDAKPLILRNQAEKVYVRDILVVSGVTMDTKFVRLYDGGMIDTTVFYYLEDKQGATNYDLEQKDADELQDSEKGEVEKERKVLERRMLFDCVNDSLTTILDPYQHSEPWTKGLSTAQPLRRRPTGQALVQQLWDDLSALPPQNPCDDVCASLYSVLHKDLQQPRNSWTEFADEVQNVGLEIERMILKELIEETLIDISQQAVFGS